MTDQRQLYRVAIDRTGLVRRGDQAYSCHVIDLTEQGVRLEINETSAFQAGDELQLEFALTDADRLACTIQVTNLRLPYIGGAIVQMAAEQQKRLSTFIEQVNGLSMTGF